jgi:hypothetical protein
LTIEISDKTTVSLFRVFRETAFLISEIDNIIYAEQSAGYLDLPYLPNDYVSPQQRPVRFKIVRTWLWSNHVKNKLISLGFRQSDADESIFVRQDGHNITIVAVYIDDSFPTPSNKSPTSNPNF